MTDPHRTVWLVTNRASGSNDLVSVDSLSADLAGAGWPVVRTQCFPDEGVPSVADLKDAGDPVVAVFTGDGTANSVATALEGWDGQVLILPGGTQNLLARRMHGRADARAIIARLARGASRPVRIAAIGFAGGQALVDLLVGPGASWNTVREAMREGDLPAIVGGAGEALRESTGGTGVRCADPALGSADGYPLVRLTPSHRGIQVDAYHADNLRDFLAQGWAMLRRDFRQGPHDRLGLVDRLALDKADESPLDVLVDGEPRQLGPRPEFTLRPFELDLLATHHGY